MTDSCINTHKIRTEIIGRLQRLTYLQLDRLCRTENARARIKRQPKPKPTATPINSTLAKRKKGTGIAPGAIR